MSMGLPGTRAVGINQAVDEDGHGVELVHIVDLPETVEAIVTALGGTGGGAHPDLAAHNTLGLATQAELDAVASAKADSAHAHVDADIPAGIARDAEVSAAIATHAATPHGGGSGESIPAGIIAMWSGLLSAIPTGWLLCDGTSGTPDLRDRFIVGAAAAANPGATGGSATHTHAAHSGVLAHGHGVTDPGHAHVENLNSATTGGLRGATPDTSTSTSTATGFSTASAQSGITVDSAGSGSEYTHDSPSHLPPYFALAFIMKAV